MLAISDNGLGMDSKPRSTFSNIFYTTKEKGKGTGLDCQPFTESSSRATVLSGSTANRGKGLPLKSIFPAVRAKLRGAKLKSASRQEFGDRIPYLLPKMKRQSGLLQAGFCVIEDTRCWKPLTVWKRYA